MKFQPRRGLGILLMAVSVVSLVTALYTLFFYVDERKYGEAPERDYHGVIDEQMPNPGIPYSDDINGVPNMGPVFPYWYKWPYRWLSKPLAIVGIFFFLTGLLIGYHDDILQIF